MLPFGELPQRSFKNGTQYILCNAAIFHQLLVIARLASVKPIPLLFEPILTLSQQAVRRRTCNAKITRSIRVVGKLHIFFVRSLKAALELSFFCVP
jgi:hypothetical protein